MSAPTLDQMIEEQYGEGYVIVHESEVKAAPPAASEPVKPDYYKHEDSDDVWLEVPHDCSVLEELERPIKVGDEYECDVCWAGKQRFRIVKVVDEESDDYEVELVHSSRDLFAAPQPTPALIEAARQALTMLELCNQHGWMLADHEAQMYAALIALRAALEGGRNDNARKTTALMLTF